MSEMQCVAGCQVFEGGETRHHKDCPHYPESLTKLWHDREAELLAEIERLRAASKPALGDKTKAVEYEKEGARETYKEVVGSDVGRTMTVSKHVASNHVHLRNVIAEADEQCPRAADTIRWMLWHNVLRVNRIANMVTDHSGPSTQLAGSTKTPTPAPRSRTTTRSTAVSARMPKTSGKPPRPNSDRSLSRLVKPTPRQTRPGTCSRTKMRFEQCRPFCGVAPSRTTTGNRSPSLPFCPLPDRSNLAPSPMKPCRRHSGRSRRHNQYRNAGPVRTLRCQRIAHPAHPRS